MRRLIAIVLLSLVPLAAQAETGTIDWLDNQPHLNRVDTVTTGVRYDIVGQFVVTLDLDGNYQSFEVPADAVALTVFEDGSVEFTLGTPVTYIPQPIYDVEVVPEPSTSAFVYPV